MGGHPLRLEMVLTKRYLGGVAVIVLVGGFAVFWHVQSKDAPIKHLAAWQRLASPGDLSAAHSRLDPMPQAKWTLVLLSPSRG